LLKSVTDVLKTEQRSALPFTVVVKRSLPKGYNLQQFHHSEKQFQPAGKANQILCYPDGRAVMVKNAAMEDILVWLVY
jgi:hypothetical protein